MFRHHYDDLAQVVQEVNADRKYAIDSGKKGASENVDANWLKDEDKVNKFSANSSDALKPFIGNFKGNEVFKAIDKSRLLRKDNEDEATSDRLRRISKLKQAHLANIRTMITG